MLILLFEEIVLPCVTYPENGEKIGKQLLQVVPILQKIVWICYTNSTAQTYKGIRLFLHVLCLQLSFAIDNLPKELDLIDLFCT